MNCDPVNLMRSSKCFCRLPRRQQNATSISMLCEWLKKKVEPVVEPFSFEPDDSMYFFEDSSGVVFGPFSNATFNATADLPTVSNINFSVVPRVAALHNLSSLPSLSAIGGYSESVTTFDVSGCHNLTRLGFGGSYPGAQNQVSSIVGLSDCPLFNFLSFRTGQLVSVDISSNPLLNYVLLKNHKLTTASVDAILSTLVAHGLSDGTCNLSGAPNQAPSASGLLDKATLVSRSWSVLTVP